tara:strand:- start:428 stop:706 length:279 start_codon:yes stop_codon:yes gene_type:complete
VAKKDLETGIGLDTYSDPFTSGETINTVYDNVVVDSFGREVKREGLKLHTDSDMLEGTRTSELFYWVEDNLINNRAWISYDRVTGQIKIKEG